jgi:hypothetical protein
MLLLILCQEWTSAMDNEVRNPNGQNYLTNCSRILKILPLGDSITSGGGIIHLLESRGNRQGDVEYSFAGPPIFVMDEADRQTEARELISSMIEDEDDKLTLSKVCFLVEICVCCIRTCSSGFSGHVHDDFIRKSGGFSGCRAGEVI